MPTFFNPFENLFSKQTAEELALHQRNELELKLLEAARNREHYEGLEASFAKGIARLNKYLNNVGTRK